MAHHTAGEMSDELFKKVILGDEKAFEEVFSTHFRSMCFYAKLFGLSLEQAKEIVQFTFLRFWEVRSQIQPIGPIQHYLFKAVRNNSLNYLRKHKSQLSLIDAEANISALENEIGGDISGHETLVYGELEQRFKAALEDLPPKMRQIFVLSRYEGFSYKEIAEELNISVKTVETQMSKALAKLRVELKEYLPFLLFLSPKIFF